MSLKKRLDEYRDREKIKKLERDYFDTLDEDMEKLINLRIRQYEKKYNKRYFLE